jgi:hypothetical protein
VVTTKKAFVRSGCKGRLAYPGCGTDNDLGIVVGSYHEVPTENEKRALDRHFDRLAAFRERQAASWARPNNEQSPSRKSVQLVRGDEVDPPQAETAMVPSPVASPQVPAGGGAAEVATLVTSKGGGSSPPAPDVKTPRASASARAPRGDGADHSTGLVYSLAGGGSNNSKKASKAGAPSSVSPDLSVTVYVLEDSQLPLLSLNALERAAKEMGESLGFQTFPESNTASLTWSVVTRWCVAMCVATSRPTVASSSAPTGQSF